MSIGVEFQSVHKRYGTRAVLRGVDFSVARGEIVGLLGPNGCGKTTTLRLIAGVLAPDAGQVRVCGQVLCGGPLAARRRIGYLPEKPPLYDALRVRDYLAFVAASKGLNGEARHCAVAAALRDYGLTQVSQQVIATLSKGYRQRVGLAQATLADPEVLLLDEATNGLDALQIVEARALIRSGAAGRAVIFCSHLMQEVDALCDRVIVLHDGRSIELGDADPTPRLTMRLRRIGVDAASALAANVPEIAVSECCTEGEVVVLRCTSSGARAADALARAFIAHATLVSLEPERPTLEDRFVAAMRRESQA